MTLSRLLSVGALCALACVGCKEKEEPPLIRPVLSIVVAEHTQAARGFAGTVEPRYRSNLGFRVLGRIIVRDINVGDLVTQGERLAAIDAMALEFALRSARADLSSAEAQLANATATEARQRALLETNTTTPAQYELAQRARDSAAAAVTRVRANLAIAQEQLGYAQLRAEFDGVVTSVDAEVGQVVSPGQTVVTIARPDVREAVVDVPDELAPDIKPGVPFTVAWQVDPSIRTQGVVREIAPQADSLTRTRRIRITLDSPPASFRLGTTITAYQEAVTVGRVIVPATAILRRDDKTMVWVVDAATSSVATQEVRTGRTLQGGVEIESGLAVGTRVVVAGVNSLTAGQRVKLAGNGSAAP